MRLVNEKVILRDMIESDIEDDKGQPYDGLTFKLNLASFNTL